MRTIQTCGGMCDGDYSITVAFEKHAVSLEGLSKEDMLHLQSCIDCMLMEDEDGIGTTS
jgi:hypothetical protein